ncbi:MAG: hypothetical protein JWN37_276 [Candidatus Nomurabacteria bacterium]|nr:hypothetical protein [Candidatus Nomurabacteria bacterium]
MKFNQDPSKPEAGIEAVIESGEFPETQEEREARLGQLRMDETLHEAHVEASIEDQKARFQKYKQEAEEKLSKLSSNDSYKYVIGDKYSPFYTFFYSLQGKPLELGEGGRFIIANLEEIKALAKKGLAIYYQALKENPPTQKEVINDSMPHLARAISNDLLAERTLKGNNDPKEYYHILDEEDYRKLRFLGDQGGHNSEERDREKYLTTLEFIKKL